MPSPSDYMCSYGNMRDDIKDWIQRRHVPTIKELQELLDNWNVEDD